MIKSISVTNVRGETVQLEMGRSDQTGLSILGIDGLGPPRTDIQMTNMVLFDGAVFNSSRAVNRNITITLGVVDIGEGVEQVRLNTYRWFPLKEMVKMVVETGIRKVQTTGYVETLFPSIFDKKPIIQISIICPDAFFKGYEKQETVFNGVSQIFTFPFSNNSLTEDLLIMGSLNLNTFGTILYDGDAPNGLEINLHFIGPVTGLVLHNTTTRETMTFNSSSISSITGSGISYGDDIYINTIKGEKSVILTRNETKYNILNAVQITGNWFTLIPGDNVFAFTALSGLENVQFKAVNTTLLVGV